MKILLLANQPDKTTRLKMFCRTLQSQGHEVIIPSFKTRNWITISGMAKKIARERKPDVVHIFNVPDVIYHGFAALRGEAFRKLIYDYRSPWGIEVEQTFGAPGRAFAEHFERELAGCADIITTVNAPLKRKVLEYAPEKEVHVIPNYPSRSFSETKADSDGLEWTVAPGREPIVFIGRICTQEGIEQLLEAARAMPEQEFWIIGGGPFAQWYLWRKPANVRVLGWQPHDRIAAILRRAGLCLIPREENALTAYSTEKSVWKLNEYLALGKIVVASGVTAEEQRKNLVVVKSTELKGAILESLEREPEKLGEEDYRFWEMNERTIQKVYESL
ncbi:MAG: glycosyltransferase family 4 protein [Methanothrix sp.]|nr:glycosyltransferase family 4 protein [Methanothrix sp.]